MTKDVFMEEEANVYGSKWMKRIAIILVLLGFQQWTTRLLAHSLEPKNTESWMCCGSGCGITEIMVPISRKRRTICVVHGVQKTHYRTKTG